MWTLESKTQPANKIVKGKRSKSLYPLNPDGSATAYRCINLEEGVATIFTTWPLTAQDWLASLNSGHKPTAARPYQRLVV